MSTVHRALAAAALAVALLGCQSPAQDQATGPDVTDLAARPVVTRPTGAPPDDLVVTDVVVGEGEPAVAGAELVTRYVGVGHASGETFDSSWDRGAPLRLRAGDGTVIPGWELALLGDDERGIAPMRVGGRRQVVVPPALAYGPALVGGLQDPGDTTLVFVIDLVAVG